MPDLTRLLVDASPEVGHDQDTDLLEMRDISSQIDTDGTVHWSAPAGEQSWEILRIGYTSPMRASPRQAALGRDLRLTTSIPRRWINIGTRLCFLFSRPQNPTWATA